MVHCSFTVNGVGFNIYSLNSLLSLDERYGLPFIEVHKATQFFNAQYFMQVGQPCHLICSPFSPTSLPLKYITNIYQI